MNDDNNENSNDSICEGVDKLYNQVVQKENFLNYDKNNLLNFLSIRESIPFHIYFKNQIIRLIKADSLEKHLIFKIKKENFNLIDSIIKINQSEIKNNFEKQNELQPKNKENKKEDSNININIPNKEETNINITNKEDSKDNLNKTNEESSKNNISLTNKECSKDNINKSKMEDSKTKNVDKSNISSISFDLGFLKEKLEKQKNDIDELIAQKESLLNQIINENNESNQNRLKYFLDMNNLSGNQFENAGIKYIFELINCLSIKQDFYFYYNIEVKTEKYNEIFKFYHLNEIENLQVDFIISDLRIIDFINMLIYLYPNIIDLNNLKKEPFEKGMNFDNLIELREKYKKSQVRLDIFGEIGQNIFNEDEKIKQSKKYRTLCYNLKELIKDDKKEEDFKIVDEILDILKMKQNNKKLILFLTNGEYSDIFNKKLND